MKTNQVLRHTMAVRAVHWLVVFSGFILVFSGLGQLPLYKRYFVDKLPGLSWSSNYEITLTMHLIGAAIFGAAILFHIIYHIARSEYAAMPKKGDVKESIHIIKAMMKGEKEPPHEKFLAEQRLAYLALGVVSLILLLTGIIKVYKNLGPVPISGVLVDATTLIHTAATPVFMLLVVAHLAAFIIKANRPLLPSMVTGYVSREYAEERHPLWHFDQSMEQETRGSTPASHNPQQQPS